MPRGATVRLLEWAFERLQREEARHHPRPEKIARFEKLVSRLLDVSYAEERRSPRGNLLKVDVGKTKVGGGDLLRPGLLSPPGAPCASKGECINAGSGGAFTLPTYLQQRQP